jgi:hypothetical protein
MRRAHQHPPSDNLKDALTLKCTQFGHCLKELWVQIATWETSPAVTGGDTVPNISSDPLAAFTKMFVRIQNYWDENHLLKTIPFCVPFLSLWLFHPLSLINHCSFWLEMVSNTKRHCQKGRDAPLFPTNHPGRSYYCPLTILLSLNLESLPLFYKNLHLSAKKRKSVPSVIKKRRQPGKDFSPSYPHMGALSIRQLTGKKTQILRAQQVDHHGSLKISKSLWGNKNETRDLRNSFSFSKIAKVVKCHSCI